MAATHSVDGAARGGMSDPRIQELLDFWRAAGPKAWFSKKPEFDAEFDRRFRACHMAAARRQLDHWSDHAEGSLALLVLLDQFPRNAFRGTAHMYATDALARVFAARAVERGHDEQVDPSLRVFFYLPFEHSECMDDQRRSVSLAQALDTRTRAFAFMHRDIIERFGRFPHRNAALGRATTPAEQEFLDGGGFGG
jgi:uncharacterized protein (DUF924 family)